MTDSEVRSQQILLRLDRIQVVCRRISWLCTCLQVGGVIATLVILPSGIWKVLSAGLSFAIAFYSVVDDVRDYWATRQSPPSVRLPQSLALLARFLLPAQTYERVLEPSLADLTVEFTAKLAESRDDPDRKQALIRRFKREQRMLVLRCLFEYAKDRVGAAIRFLPNPFRS
jgi:hypothetical protein